MNDDTLQGKWEQVKGNIKSKWGKLTDDDLKEAEGDQQRLAGKIQEKYGTAKEKVLEELKSLTGG